MALEPSIENFSTYLDRASWIFTFCPIDWIITTRIRIHNTKTILLRVLVDREAPHRPYHQVTAYEQQGAASRVNFVAEG